MSLFFLKAALFAIDTLFEESYEQRPIFVSIKIIQLCLCKSYTLSIHYQLIHG